MVVSLNYDERVFTTGFNQHLSLCLTIDQRDLSKQCLAAVFPVGEAVSWF